jgi:hypothetical protein
VTDEDRRAAYLAEHDAGGLTAADVADLDALGDLLKDEAAWVEPPGDLGERIATSIAAESNAASNVVPLAPRRSLRWPLAILGAAAAVIAIVLAITLTGGGNGKAHTQFAAALTGTPLAPGASGHVTLTKTHGGWRIKLDASGLPRRDPPQYYEAWLKNAAGVLVPIGTFNSGPHVTLWSAVSPADFPTLTITKQTVGTGESSTGLVVLSGEPTEVR